MTLLQPGKDLVVAGRIARELCFATQVSDFGYTAVRFAGSILTIVDTYSIITNAIDVVRQHVCVLQPSMKGHQYNKED